MDTLIKRYIRHVDFLQNKICHGSKMISIRLCINTIKANDDRPDTYINEMSIRFGEHKNSKSKKSFQYSFDEWDCSFESLQKKPKWQILRNKTQNHITDEYFIGFYFMSYSFCICAFYVLFENSIMESRKCFFLGNHMELYS